MATTPTDGIDFALVPFGKFYDLEIANGDYVSADSFDTAIVITMFVERRADETEQPVNQYRRGWVGNILSEVEGYEIGSDLWQFSQSRATQETLNSMNAKLLEAFEWFVADGLLVNVLINSILNIGTIEVKIDFVRSNSEPDSKSFKLWENTGTGAI